MCVLVVCEWIAGSAKLWLLYFSILKYAKGFYHVISDVIIVSLVCTLLDTSKRACRSLNAIAAQLKNCQFSVNNTIELKTIKTTNNNNNNNKTQSQHSQNSFKVLQGNLSCVFFCSFVKHIVYWVMPLLHSMSDTA